MKVRQSFPARVSRLGSLICSLIFFVLAAAVPQAESQAPNTWRSVPMPPNVKDRMQAVHIALLPNGKVLIVNGSSFRDSLDDNGNITFGSDVLNYQVVNNASVFDPQTDQYQRIDVPPIPVVDGKQRSGDIFCAGLIHLEDGRVIFAGGTKLYYPSGMFEGRRGAVIFDWQSNSWTTLPDMRRGRWYPTLLRLYNGQIATFSGILDTDKTANNPQIEFYDPERNLWTMIDMTDIPGSPLNTRVDGGAFDLVHHYPRLFPMPDGRIFFSHDGSGMGNMQSRNTYFLKLDFTQPGQAPAATFSPGPQRPATNKVYSAGMIDPVNGDFLLSGGQIGAPGLTGPGPYAVAGTQVLADLDRLSFDDRGRGSWRTTENFFSAEVGGARIMHYMVALPNGQVLVTGGGNFAFQRPIYEPLLLTADSAAPGGFRQELMTPGLQPRLYHNTALVLPDGSIFVAGGNANRAVRKPDGEIVLATYKPPAAASTFVEPGQAYISAEIWQAEIYYPPYWSDERPEIVEAPSQLVYSETASMTVSTTSSTGSLSLISLGAPTHGFDSGQRFADLQITEQSSQDGATQDGDAHLTFKAPDNPYLYPPGYYMLFYVEASGIPSHAKIIQLQNNDANPQGSPS